MDSQNVSPSFRHIRPAGAWRGVALLALAASATACGTKPPGVTGVLVTAVFSGIDANQLEVSVSTAQGVALNPKRRPEKAGASLKTPQSVSVYLPDALAREQATCTVTALKDGEIVATGTGTGTLVLHKLVTVLVQLEAGAGDGSVPQDGGDGEVVDAPAGDAPAETGAAGTGGQDAGGESPTSLKANGVACASPAECESTFCVDGVCCASACAGLCEACNLANKPGTCSPEAAGTPAPGIGPNSCAGQPASTCGFDGTCDGNGGCRRHQAGVPCKAGACVAGMPSYQPAGACDGQGTCVVPAVIDCKPYVCDSSGTPACLTTCRAGGSDCAAPATCTGNSCGAKVLKMNGAGCAAGTDCTSGHCVDGVCCNMTCAGACTSCNQTGKEGMCLPVPAGKLDPRKVCVDQGATTCGRNGLCDGAGACALYPATTVCAAASCNNRYVRPERHCDGKGACATVTDVDCMPYRCNPTTTTCNTMCTVNSDCSTNPRRCNNGTCG
jgi:hypothetical protein